MASVLTAIEVTGRVNAPTEPASFAAHRILFTYRVQTDGADGTPATVAQASSVNLDADGSFALAFDAAGELLAPIEAAVLAPTGEVLARADFTPNQLKMPLTLSAQPVAAIEVPANGGAPPSPSARVTGRVIDRAGTPVSAGIPIVLWGIGIGLGPDAAQPLLSATTQVGGYFSGPQPADRLSRAYARVAGGTPVEIALVDEHVPSRIIVVIDTLPSQGEDCDCHAVPPRAPGAADLVANSAAFSQDLGGRCIDLTMPNRVLEEFTYHLVVRTTEPAVRPMATVPPRRVPAGLVQQLVGVAGEVTTAREQRALTSRLGGSAAAGLAPLSASLDTTAVRGLLRAPDGISLDSVHEAALTAETRDVLRIIDLFRQPEPTRMPLDGTRPIAWDAAPTIFEATTVALGHVLHFRQVWRADGYSLGDLLYSLPLAPGQRRHVALLDWERRETSARSEVLEEEETLSALAARDRDISEIVGSHLDERTDAGSSTSTWAAGGGIGAGFIGGSFGIFGGIAGGGSGASSSSWQDSARTLSGSSMQDLRDRTMQRASAVRDQRSTVVQTVAQGETVRAETEVVANYNHCHAITIEYFDVLRHFLVTHELAQVTECIFVPFPLLPFDQAKARRWRTPLVRWLRDPTLAPGFDALDRIASNWDGWDVPDERYSEEAPEVLDGELRVSFVLPRPRDDKDGQFQVDEWRWLSPFLDTAPLALWTAQLAAREQAERDAYFRDHVAPGIAEGVVRRMQFAYVNRSGAQIPVKLDATLVSRFQEGVPLYVRIRPAGHLSPLPREEIARFRVFFDATVHLFGLDISLLPPDARILVHSGKMRYKTPHLTHLLFDDARINNDLARSGSLIVGTPTDADERRNPRHDDEELADRLLRHLNEHVEYYHQAIWSSMDPARRYMLLDGILAPNAGGRSVASVVENRLLGIVGNCLVLPVTPGIHLEPTLAPDPKTGEPVNLLEAYGSDPPPPIRVSVPTRGVYAEAVAGACNSCEAKDDRRFWRWEQSPIPEQPTGIAPLSTDSRASAEPTLTPTPFPQPIVSIQNAAALPDPLGLNQAMQILAKSDIFRDPTGLAGTQRNALGAFKGVMDTAKFFGGEAAKLASQQQLGQNVDRTLDQVRQARDTGLISPDQAQELAHAALQGLVGDHPADQRSPVHDPTVSKAIDAATQSSSGEVTVTGSGETVHASFDGGDTGVGAKLVAKDQLVEHWISFPYVHDTASGTPLAYNIEAAINDLASLQKKSPMRRLAKVAGHDVVVYLWKALEKANYLRVDPSDATKYQLKLRLRVFYPTRAGKPSVIAGDKPLPLAMLMHGSHNAWVPDSSVTDRGTTEAISATDVREVYDFDSVTERASFEGYAYLQKDLAENGIVSASLDANFPNLMNSLIEARADLLVAALNYLGDLNDAEATENDLKKFHGRLDLSNVGIMGHSRGGDAVVRAAQKLRHPPAPQTPRFNVKVVCSLAPTDYSGAGDVAKRISLADTDTGFYFVLYGSRDEDVIGEAANGFGTGFRHYDRARCPKSMVFLDNCAHTPFNTVWFADPDYPMPAWVGAVITEDKHHKLAVEYICGLFRWQFKGEKLAGLFDGRVANKVGEHASIQWMFGAMVKQIDDFETSPKNLLGASRDVTDPTPGTAKVEDIWAVKVAGNTILKHLPHRTTILHVDLTPGAPPDDKARVLRTETPGLDDDWSAYDTLVVSLAGWFDPTDQNSIDNAPMPRIKVELYSMPTASTSVAVVDWKNYGDTRPSRPVLKISPDYGNITLMRLETIPIPLSLFSGVDLHHIGRVAIVVDPPNNTNLFVDNVAVVKR